MRHANETATPKTAVTELEFARLKNDGRVAPSQYHRSYLDLGLHHLRARSFGNDRVIRALVKLKKSYEHAVNGLHCSFGENSVPRM